MKVNIVGVLKNINILDGDIVYIPDIRKKTPSLGDLGHIRKIIYCYNKNKWITERLAINIDGSLEFVFNTAHLEANSAMETLCTYCEVNNYDITKVKKAKIKIEEVSIIMED